MNMTIERRGFLISAAAMALTGGARAFAAAAKEPEVTATEDLMREHGIIRRALIVYSETASKLISASGSVDGAALHDTANLFRTFGENYHEKLLEEQHIFPVVRKAGGALEHLVDTLTKQHERGREITEYILAATKNGTVRAPGLARVLIGFVRMYEAHAAREDTVVFPAWKSHYTDKQLDELADKFEEIEKKTFGHDGFEDAEKTISGIERRLGLADLAVFTPEPPPKV